MKAPIKREGCRVVETFPAGVEVSIHKVGDRIGVIASDRLPYLMSADGKKVPLVKQTSETRQ